LCISLLKPGVVFQDKRMISFQDRSEVMGAGKTLLVVEDSRVVQGAMRLVLEWEGYHVLSADNGQEALNLLRRGERPAVILLDVGMPVLDGWQFREEQLKDPDLAHIPVVVVSGIDIASTMAAQGHVQKPFVPDELLGAIRRAEQVHTV
jgi:CheY-like chemotaxis protein